MSVFQIDGAIGQRLLNAWEDHGSFGPAFVQVYEEVTSAVDAISSVLRNGASAEAVMGYAKEFSSAVGRDRHAVRSRVMLKMRRAGLSLQAIARLVEEPIDDIVQAAHNVELADGDFLLLDELLMRGGFTVAELAKATGLRRQAISRLAATIGRELADGRHRTSSDAALLMVRQLHFLQNVPKGEAIRQTQAVHPEMTKGSGYAALRSRNGVAA